MKSVRIRSFTGPYFPRSFSGSYFPAFGLNTERYSLCFHIYCKCRKLRTRKTPNTDTFHVVKKYVRVAVHQFHCYLEYMGFSKGEVNDTRWKHNFVKVRPNFTRKHVSIWRLNFQKFWQWISKLLGSSKSDWFQERIQNPVKYLGWSVLQE